MIWIVPKVLLWTSLAFVFYAYAGYPVMGLLASFFVRRRARPAAVEPTVSLLIAAYNEEKDIEEKLENSLALEYPPEKLEIVVASDGSTDRTDEIVKAFAARSSVKVTLHRVEGRVGKTGAQNSGVEVCTGDIIVFSDAASLYDPGAIRALVRPYGDPQVGGVSGRYEYKVLHHAPVGFGTKVFWRLENFIKERQSRLGSLTGASGCIYSVRRALYAPLPPDVVSDMVEPIMVVRQGYRVEFARDALAWEETAGRSNEEFRMRVRVIVGGIFGLGWVLRRLNPLRFPMVWFQLVSHKLMRWLVPVYAIVALASSILLAPQSHIYATALALQIAFYIAAGLGWLAEKTGHRVKLLTVPWWLLLSNYAALISLLRVLRGRNVVTWQPLRS